jgi:hypothetical protein
MKDWVWNRAPTKEEVGDYESCVLHAKDHSDKNFTSAYGEFARRNWQFYDRWIIVPEAKKPEPEMPEEVLVWLDGNGRPQCETAIMPLTLIPHEAIPYVRKNYLNTKRMRCYAISNDSLECDCGARFTVSVDITPEIGEKVSNSKKREIMYCPFCGASKKL